MALKIVCDCCKKESEHGVALRDLNFEKTASGAAIGLWDSDEPRDRQFCSDNCAAEYLLCRLSMYRGGKVATEVFERAMAKLLMPTVKTPPPHSS